MAKECKRHPLFELDSSLLNFFSFKFTLNLNFRLWLAFPLSHFFPEKGEELPHRENNPENKNDNPCQPDEPAQKIELHLNQTFP